MTETHDITVDQGGLESSPPDADVNTARTASEDYIDAPTPVLQQYLRISHIEREVGAARLKRAAIAKKLADEADEAERKKKEAWLAIPRRLRGRVVSRCLRLRCGLFLMFTAYKFPNKPKYMTFSGLVLSSTYRESINFSSNVLVQTLGSDQNYRVRPEEWAPDTLRTIAGKSIAKFTLVDADFKVGKAGIGYNGGGVVEFEFKALR
jgi:hypothetical protein